MPRASRVHLQIVIKPQNLARQSFSLRARIRGRESAALPETASKPNEQPAHSDWYK